MNDLSKKKIPKLLHIVWIGDESKRPDGCIASWRNHHPDWDFRLWGNSEYEGRKWRLRSLMDEMWQFELAGVTDLMRWEILSEEGGITVDADSECLERLPDWLLTCEAFCSAANEVAAPGRLTNAFMGSKPRNSFFSAIVEYLLNKTDPLYKKHRFFFRKRIPAWKAVGPMVLTRQLSEQRYTGMTVLPSHFFTPRHMSGVEYSGGGPVYARQLYGSTFGYDSVIPERLKGSSS
jgi:mannosyltransferase OCH1-like enzyme